MVMADSVRQGSVLELSERAHRVLVLSKSFFNQSGMAIVCPVEFRASEDALHIPIHAGHLEGIALCEQMKSIDLTRRFYRIISQIDYTQVQYITDVVQSIFDYYPYDQ